MEKGVVETCLQKISDPFTLVVLASYRSQELASGMTACIPTEGSKDALVALKEISSGKLDIPELEDRMVHSLQKFAFLSEEGLNDPAHSITGIKTTERSEKPSFQAEALFHAIPSEKTISADLSSLESDDDDLDDDLDQDMLWDSEDNPDNEDLDNDSATESESDDEEEEL